MSIQNLESRTTNAVLTQEADGVDGASLKSLDESVARNAETDAFTTQSANRFCRVVRSCR